MTLRKSRKVMALLAGAVALWLAGCKAGRQPNTLKVVTRTSEAAVATEVQNVGEAALGKGAEVLAHGDLARNGLQQVLVINRFGIPMREDTGLGNSSGIFITRAAILEKNNGRWAEVLRCDEHLTNSRGYLGGAPVAPVTMWRLDVAQDTAQGLELRFARVEISQVRSSAPDDEEDKTIVVRWNTKTKRYQSLDQSHKGYLGEVPTLETPQSILK
jgi:hypothetical protein